MFNDHSSTADVSSLIQLLFILGYCGADIKALCTEAAMLALRRRYPQIYITNEALELDVSSINISAKDFFE